MGLSPFNETRTFIAGTIVGDATPFPTNLLTLAIRSDVSIDQILLTSDDTIDHQVTLIVAGDLTASVPIGTFLLPAGSGYSSAVPPRDALPAILSTLASIQLTKYDELRVSISPPLSAGKFVNIFATGGYF